MTPYPRPKRDDDEDDLDGLLDAKLGAQPKSLAPRPQPMSPMGGPQPQRQNFGGPQPLQPHAPGKPGAPTRPTPMPVMGARATLTPKPAEAARTPYTGGMPPPPAGGLPPTDSRLAIGGLDGGKGRTVKSPGGIDGTTYQDSEWTETDHRDEGGADEPPVDDDQAALDALADELERSAAQNQTNAARVSGLGGFGLNGAGVAQAADIGRADADSRVLALQDLMNAQDDQDFQDVQRDAVTYDLEETQDRDLDGDGLVAGQSTRGDGFTGIGDGNPDNNPVADEDRTPEERESGRIEALSQEEFENETQESLEAAGWRFVRTVDDESGHYAIWEGPDGTQRKAFIGSAAEAMSNGLEWK